MNLRTFLDNMVPDDRRAFAKKVGTTANYLNLLHYGVKVPGPLMARKIHDASGQQIPLHELRPDIWKAA